MCDVESPLEVIGLYGIKKPLCLFDIVRQIVNFGVFGFQVVIFKIDRYVGFFRPMYQSFHAFYGSISARGYIAKVIAPMADDPAASQLDRQIKIGVYIDIDGLG